jgi:hypothetical protein
MGAKVSRLFVFLVFEKGDCNVQIEEWAGWSCMYDGVSALNDRVHSFVYRGQSVRVQSDYLP